MTKVTAELVRTLRERIGIGMMECKKALEEANGDIDLAVELMRKAGKASADKKLSRTATEGLIVIKTQADGKAAVLLEINCETDFVARDDSFKSFSENVADIALHHKANDVAALMSLPMEGDDTVEQVRQILVAKIGENIQVRRLSYMEVAGTTLGTYTHGGRIGVLVDLQGGDATLAKDLAMHIAANNPLVISRHDVPEAWVSKEREIFTAQAQATGKPAAVLEKMIEGKVNKFLDEINLLEQSFVKDTTVTVAQLLDQSKAKVLKFVRYAVAEGLEKKTEDFAKTVSAMVGETNN